MDTLLTIHVVMSLLALLWGLLFSLQLLQNTLTVQRSFVFLLLTLLTSLTGMILPAEKLLPSHLFVGLTLLLLALYARYAAVLQGRWHQTFIICTLLTFYLNAFVAVVQAFLKIPLLQPLAPTQTEPAFIFAQTLLFLTFAVLIYRACIRNQTIP